MINNIGKIHGSSINGRSSIKIDSSNVDITGNLITKGMNGIPKIPGDKSISHRSIIIPSISNGICEINNI